jgi:hypothetical protein
MSAHGQNTSFFLIGVGLQRLGEVHRKTKNWGDRCEEMIAPKIGFPIGLVAIARSPKSNDFREKIKQKRSKGFRLILFSAGCLIQRVLLQLHYVPIQKVGEPLVPRVAIHAKTRFVSGPITDVFNQ